ncbi:MAG: glycosyltransferase [Coriobacteriia bacterium]
MTASSIRILQVSAADIGGGAERVASDLHRSYLARGLEAWLAVGQRKGDTPNVYEIATPAASTFSRARRRLARALADPHYLPDKLRGLEDFSFPATRRLLEIPPAHPDVLHLHNLHGAYFDLRALPTLTHAVPTVVTLHDTWLLAGHCAYAMGCERWKTGCGRCPDLGRPLALTRDSTAANWRRKRDLYRRSRLVVAGPSRWVLDAAAASMLAEATIEQVLVPNGVDTDIFAPGSRERARAEVGLPKDAFIMAFSSAGGDVSPFKDMATILRALPAIAEGFAGSDLRMLAIGAADASGDERVITVPFSADPRGVARILNAADVYVHMAHGENFPLAILEAQACGLPVVASAVGGIPETLVPGVTGLLVPEGDHAALADAIVSLGRNEPRLRSMAAAAVEHVRGRHSIDAMTDAYLRLYARVSETSGPA